MRWRYIVGYKVLTFCGMGVIVSRETDAEDGQHFSQGIANLTELLDSELNIASAWTGNLDEAELAEKKLTRKVLIEEV
jgi:soluble cytochrome b562